ncbi:MAG: hypothetical protein M1829_001897 [Trizodia sp. TS-e1964]|nr:MAG: hypothetical protein M1829_001897 [Trizodia sp. TS-e1964]
MASQLPQTYKAAVFEKVKGGLTIKDLPMKEPKQGEVLIKVLACGVCHSDSMLEEGIFGDLFPRVPGHEIVGDIVVLGPNENHWKVGDRVGGGWHGGHDSTCISCKRGLFQMCDNELINGFFLDGGYAEYCILRSEALASISKDVDPAEVAPLLCAGVTVFNGIRQLKVLPGEIVGIQGLGGLGHLGIQYANRMGYKVVAISSSAGKEKFAAELGAFDYIDTSKEDVAARFQSMGGAALIVTTSPNADAAKPLIKALGKCGKLLMLSAGLEIPVNSADLIMAGRSVHGWPSGAALDSEEAVKFAATHKVKCMIERFSLQDAQKAYDHMLSGKARFRAVIVF